MWSNEQSEEARIFRVLEHNKIDSRGLLQKFKSTSRDDMKLAIALRGYFFEMDTGKSEYLTYIQRRIRPSVSTLIELDLLDQLEILNSQIPISEKLVDEFLRIAISKRRTEIIVWLLELKNKNYGFKDKTFKI